MDPDKSTVAALLALNSVNGLGPVRIKALIGRFGSPLSLFEREGRAALVQAASAFSGGDAVDPPALLDAAQEQLMRAESLGIMVLTWDHDAYPPLLREIYAPPPVLFVKGKLDSFTGHACAVVGTRGASQYGRNAAAHIVKKLVEKRVAVVSGLALGIDTVAHTTCLDCGGVTIAVLGCGLDTVYPAANRELSERIAESGALVSEFDLGSLPEAYHFPRRNRIIAGLSAGVLVVEAPERSGSLITAGYALQQGRDVFAVPGSIFSNASAGTFNLLRSGAIPVRSGDDILDNMTHLSMPGVAPGKVPGREAAPSMPLELLSPDEQNVASVLSAEPLRLDAIAEKAGRAVSQLFDILLSLELKGVIRQVAGQQYVRAD
ncbi:MAG TPA: DNA-processing protein DprA [Chitinivibrionales bacterium]|jgi:DNA processing protein|nr:DNA-processing protein DprA [Chitinivibrionales bacterium]